MAGDRYISVGKKVNGFSFANLGLFTGFADGIYNAVYSLVILEIFKSSAIVGIYVAIYSVFCFLVGLFANEILRMFSKARIFYFSLLMMAVCYAMMSFSILPRTFVILDYTTGIAITLSSMLIPLFMSDFSKHIGMARLNSRYHLWLNVGALFAPTVAVLIANHFGNRGAFFGSAVIYLIAWSVFKYFRIVQEDKNLHAVNPRKTVRALWKNTIEFFKLPGMLRAYLVNFGYYSLRAMRVLYVPILVIENGFDKDVLGWVLTLGIVPYLVLSEFMGRAVRRFGKTIWLVLGFGSFAALSAVAMFVTGIPLLAIFVAWQVSGALMESVHDLLFFDGTSKAQQSKYYGVFRTSANLPNVIAPILAAVVISMFGMTSAVWVVTVFIGAFSLLVLVEKKKQ
ncbi:MAG: MFS transporter [Alphaproteobacteria bacterium]|nr:MFS transporter [Alphaproteobacteria bacterium]